MKLVVIMVHIMLLSMTMLASVAHLKQIGEPKGSTRDSSAWKQHQVAVNEDKAAVLVNHVTGSKLPDCTHACGSCSPCLRVMISSRCFLSESCPIIYRCLCKGRFFHVPAS